MILQTKGDEQVLFFSMDTDEEDGPFYLPPEKRRASRYTTEVLLPPEKAGDKNRTKSDLIDDIMCQGREIGRKNLPPHPLPSPKSIIWIRPKHLAKPSPLAARQREPQPADQLGEPPRPNQEAYHRLSLQS